MRTNRFAGTRLTRAVALGAVAAIAVAACGSDDSTPAATDAAATNEGVDLSGVCPETIVIQTDWFPESEHGALYQMVGEGYEINAGDKVVSGPLVTTGGAATGVDIEIRTGGPAVGFQQVVSIMQQDTDVTMGYVATDEAIENYADIPTKAVVAPLEVNPQIIMWDPATYPDVETIADLQTAVDGGVTIRYFETGAYMKYLLSSGQVLDGQLDGSYDGSPAVFIGDGGKIAQQGFASAEPYNYEFVFEDWGKPVDFQLIHDAGWQGYAAPLAVLEENFQALTPCLELFVPIVQQAVVDYVADPSTANALIVEAVAEYNDFWVYDDALAQWSIDKQVEIGLVGNGPNSTVGDFDIPRLEAFIPIASEVFGATGLTPDSLVTNQFIDSSIGL